MSSPRMYVHSALTWPLRLALWAIMLGFCAAIGLWAFEFGFIEKILFTPLIDTLPTILSPYLPVSILNSFSISILSPVLGLRPSQKRS